MRKAIIVGGGIAGLSAGIALSKARWEVVVLERAPRLEPIGAALSLWPNACAALASLGVFPAVEAGASPINSMLLGTRDGGRILDRPIPGPALLSTRSHLQHVLQASLPPGALKLDCEVLRARSGCVEIADGETITGDLVVDAGGIGATSGACEEPRYAGYGGVLALSGPIEGSGLEGQAAEFWGWGERFGVFELPKGQRYWFYMRSQPAHSRMPNIDECAWAARGWPEQVCKAIAATPADALIPFAVHARKPPRSLFQNGILKVGDAAHAMEPNLGQGACQALEDAVALMHAASRNSAAEIGQAYEKARLDRVRMLVREAAQAGLGVHGPRAIQLLVRTALKVVPRALSELRISKMQILPEYRSRTEL
ncbi:MAG: FAD-dependent monooxygenase [Erythrobacter sp.]|jgi:2-polyprenyl-6-methoxyphenol hydroxylase-like FAD-dependent oxidoreductase|nr:FAD-dependent monooxygenase [Erythrobacter sp.]